MLLYSHIHTKTSRRRRNFRRVLPWKFEIYLVKPAAGTDFFGVFFKISYDFTKSPLHNLKIEQVGGIERVILRSSCEFSNIRKIFSLESNFFTILYNQTSSLNSTSFLRGFEIVEKFCKKLRYLKRSVTSLKIPQCILSNITNSRIINPYPPGSTPPLSRGAY